MSSLFGYVNIYKDELLVREFNEYKAIYCSLCKKLGKEYGVISRFILSYDCTFYAVMLFALKDACPGYEKKICRFNPLKKCTYVKNGEEVLSKAAALSVSSVYYKVIDNINDSKGFKRLLYRLVKPIAKRWNKKAESKFPHISNAVKFMYESQVKAENNPESHIDMAAEPTAIMLSTLLSCEGRDETEKRILHTLGYNLGKWIYLIDAVDDYKQDMENGNYNPFKGYNGEENIKEYCNQVLNQCLAQAYNSWNLLNVNLYKGIIDNIILKGLAAKQKKVLFTEEK